MTVRMVQGASDNKGGNNDGSYQIFYVPDIVLRTPYTSPLYFTQMFCKTGIICILIFPNEESNGKS